MKSIALINFYFANIIPQYMEFYLSSVSYNETVDLFLFTNLDIKSPSNNIKIIKTTFEAFSEQIENHVSEELRKRGILDVVKIETAYKIADFRPAFGLSFQEYIKDYDFWGGCDLDLIFGNIRKYVPDNVLERYDKIYEHGHFFLIKNTNQCNTAFLYDFENCFKGVLHLRKNSFFEEVYEKPWLPHGGINSIFNRKGTLYKNRKALCDVSFKYSNLIDFKNSSGSNQNIFEFNHGMVYRHALINETVKTEEVFYVHFQKRQLAVHTNNKSHFLVGNQAFEPYEKITNNTFRYTDKMNKITKRYIKFKYIDAISRKINKDFKWK